TAHVGPIASADHLVVGGERAVLAATGAIAVDMESAWLAEAAGERPLGVLRAIVATVAREVRRPLKTATGALDAYRALRRAAPALASWAAAAGPRTVLLAGPRSFCAGVERAIEVVERALDRYGPPVYVRKQIVHNVHVVRDLERRGAVFVDTLDEVPPEALVVFSAHGVSPQVRQVAGPGSDDICYATSNRQDAVKVLARESDAMLVIGSGNSSNSKRLVEVSAREGCPAWLVDDETEIDPAWLVGARTVTVTAGASAPEVLVDRVVGALRGLGPVTVEERQVMHESVQFTLPIELRPGGPPKGGPLRMPS